MSSGHSLLDVIGRFGHDWSLIKCVCVSAAVRHTVVCCVCVRRQGCCWSSCRIEPSALWPTAALSCRPISCKDWSGEAPGTSSTAAGRQTAGRETGSPWSKIWWSCLSVSALTNLKKKHLNTPPGVCLWGQRRGHVGGGASDLSNGLHGGVKPLARMNSDVCWHTRVTSVPLKQETVKFMYDVYKISLSSESLLQHIHVNYKININSSMLRFYFDTLQTVSVFVHRVLDVDQLV